MMLGDRMMRGALILALWPAVAGAAPVDPSPVGPSEVPAGRSVSAAEVSDRAGEIDRLVRQELDRRGLRPLPITDDATYLRRTYLAVAGRIPSLAEEEAFRTDATPTKRHALVDRLLEGRGHESHMFHWFADLLRAQTKLAKYTSGEPYIHFLKDAIAQNRPYDEVVRDLLTADGPAHAAGNGATGYALRDRGMPEDHIANTVRVFLGTRVECAQCHDHPFDRWKQSDFYGMVAFNGGLDYVHDDEPTARLAAFGRELRRAGSVEARRAFRRMIRPATSGLSGSGTGVAVLPDDYKYDDAAPGSLVRAAPLFGADVPLPEAAPEDEPGPDRRVKERRKRIKDALQGKAKGKGRRSNAAARAPEVDSRQAFAEWLASPDNPRFTTVIANRMWKRVMGVGLIEPVDDLRDDTVASDPALMAELERLMRDVGYDLRQFQRVLLHTDLWQREAMAPGGFGDQAETGAEVASAAPIGTAFAGPALRRMTAEQLWDSLVTLIIPDVDATLAAPGYGAREVYARFEEAGSMSDEELREWVEIEQLRVTDKKQYKRERARQNADERTEVRRARSLVKKLGRAQRRGRDRLVRELTVRLEQLGWTTAEVEQALRGRDLERASDLPSPVEPGHFLWQFGQSEREQIEASNTEANVPQALNLLNGFVEDELLSRPNAVVLEAVRAARTTDQRIDTAFRGVLGRAPTAAERAVWAPDFELKDEADVATAVDDLLWTLLNTHEFLFIR